MVNYSEAELIAKILQGEIQLYEILIRRNNPVLYKVGRSYGYNHEDVEDLMQDTFIAAYKRLGSFQFRSSFKTWLVKIMLSQCYHKCQKFSFKYEKPKSDEISDFNVPLFSAPHPTLEKEMLNLELRSVLETAIANIPLEYRMVFSMRELSGMSVAETAEALSLTESNVKVRLNRGKAMLRKEIEKSFSSEEIYEFNLIYCDRIVERVMKEITQ